MTRALPAAAIAAAILFAIPVAAENLTFCLTGSGRMIKPALGHEPRHPCIAWQSQVTIPALNVVPPLAMTTLEDLPEPTPVEIPFRKVLVDASTHSGRSEELAAGSDDLGLYVMCAYSGGTGEHILIWSFRAPMGSVMTVGGGAPREPGEFEVSDDGQNDGSSDDLALRPVPDAGVLAPDGSSISLHDAQAHMNTDEAPCTALGTATVVDATVLAE